MDSKKILKGGSIQSDTVVSTMNAFPCFAVSNPDGSETTEEVYIDNDSDGRLEIITEIQVKVCHGCKSHNMTMNVDLGAEANLML